MNKQIESLRQLYARSSKHADYQEIAPSLQAAIGLEARPTKSRHETERWNFISRHCDFRGARVLDIGGNTGYFTFQALAAGASHVRYIEGNQTHAEFVQVASSVVDPGGSIQVTNRYYDFAAEEDEVVDVAFLLNVVHHLGDDFGSKSVACHEAKELMITSVNRMARKCRRLVFQMGFCWKGNRNLLLFPNGTKQEMIDFVRAGTNGIWDVRVIGVAERDVNGISYGIPSQENLRRQDQMGEFLNRPLFVMERC